MAGALKIITRGFPGFKSIKGEAAKRPRGIPPRKEVLSGRRKRSDRLKAFLQKRQISRNWVGEGQQRSLGRPIFGLDLFPGYR